MSQNKDLTLDCEDMRRAGNEVLDFVIDHSLHNQDRAITKPTDHTCWSNGYLNRAKCRNAAPRRDRGI